MNRKYFICICCVLSLLMSTNALGAKYKWKFNYLGLKGSLLEAHAQKFKELLEKKSNGEIELTIYGWGEMGSVSDVTELCQLGVIEFTVTVPSYAAEFVPEADVFALPYLFPSDIDLEKVVNNKEAYFYRTLDKKLGKAGLMLVSMYHEGFLYWTSNKPIRKPDDFKGLKWRVVPSPNPVETIKSFGGNATPMPFGEIYSALQLNMVDGQENTISSIRDNKYYEVQDYIAGAYPYLLWVWVTMNRDFYLTLPEKYQKIIWETNRETIAYTFSIQEQMEYQALDQIKQAKPEINIYTLTPEIIEQFKQASVGVRDTFIKRVGEDGKLILENLVEELEKAAQ